MQKSFWSMYFFFSFFSFFIIKRHFLCRRLGGNRDRARLILIKTVPARCASRSSTPSSPFTLSCFFSLLFLFSSPPLPPTYKKIPPDRQRSPRSHSDIKTFPRSTHIAIFIPRNIYFLIWSCATKTPSVSTRDCARHNVMDVLSLYVPGERLKFGVVLKGSYKVESAARVEFDRAAEGVDNGDAVYRSAET